MAAAASEISASLARCRAIQDQWGLAEDLDCFAAVEAARANHERAARAAGAASTVWEQLTVQQAPEDIAMFGRFTEASRAALGPAWQVAWEEGRAGTGEVVLAALAGD